jgi:M6 family metalloprotease-like protein
LAAIRIEYNNAHFVNGADIWSYKFFSYTKHSLKHYYSEVSLGTFGFLPVRETESVPDDGIITVALNKTHPDSGTTDAIQSDLTAALEVAGDYLDFHTYDSDNNGALSINELQLIFIIAGDEDAYGWTPNPSVWAHSSCLTHPPTVDGVLLMGCGTDGSYSLFGERHGDHDATIGVIAHELGHAAFNLPDLYDTYDASSYGIGYFGLMGQGSWGSTAADKVYDLYGNTPVHFCAWSKLRNGWITPTTFGGSGPQSIQLNAASSPAYNVVKLPISETEYFLLENRDNAGYDEGMSDLAGVFDGGMAVWHIDETVIAANLANNTVNNDELHRGVDVEEANLPNLDTGGWGNEANLFYLGNTDAFTPYTDPNSNGYDGTSSGIHVENTSVRGTVMTATLLKE